MSVLWISLQTRDPRQRCVGRLPCIRERRLLLHCIAKRSKCHAFSTQRDAAGAALPYIVLPDKFASGDSFLTHDLRVTRTISINERVKFLLIGEGFNIFNIANLTGFSGTLNAYGRPATTGGTPTLPASGLTFGQPTGRFSPVFGSGGPRAFQLAARLSF